MFFAAVAALPSAVMCASARPVFLLMLVGEGPKVIGLGWGVTFEFAGDATEASRASL
jgi:hypothetical protein